jgi:class 3 adenylate cyclase
MAGIICQRCSFENPADAKFCQNCGNPLEIECPRCGTPNRIGVNFCKNCGFKLHDTASSGDGSGPSPQEQTSIPADSDSERLSRLAASAPAQLRAKIQAAAQLSGERRIVTVLFADVVGSTALAAQMDPEEWTEVMNRAFELLTPAIYRYEGTIARLMGDALLAFFGAPVAHEDDPIRAVHAALDLIAAAKDYRQEVRKTYGVDFAVRVGLNTGQVVVGDVGSDLVYEYTAMGDAVNLASRLQTAARPMNILISADTYRSIASFFEFSDLGEIQVKGKGDPVRVYEVIKSKDAHDYHRQPHDFESQMIGRAEELNQLSQAYSVAIAGLGRAVLIIGDAGIGKSRLIAELKKKVERSPDATHSNGNLPNAIWAEGHGLSFGKGQPYHLLIDLLRSLLMLDETSSPEDTEAALHAACQELFGQQAGEIYSYLGHLLSLPLRGTAGQQIEQLGPQSIQQNYFDALHQFLENQARRQPLVLVIEDLQWADASSTELLIKLLPLFQQAAMLVCCNTRPDHSAAGWKLVTMLRETMGASLTELRLSPLSREESSQMIANLLETDWPPERLAEEILQKSEGNPFYVEEVIRMLVERNVIARQADGWVIQKELDLDLIPDSLQALLLARIDRLPEDVRLVLRVASVIGRRFPVRVLEQVLEKATIT